jgi:serine/threonine-protein kinase RsbW
MDVLSSLVLRGSDEGLRAARTGLDAFAKAHGIAREGVWPFQVALDEVLSNVVRHGGPRASGLARVEVRLRLDEDALEMVVEDDAPAFNPLDAPPPDTKSPLQERTPGGLGIALVRQLMDVMEYTRAGDRNRLLLRRRVVRGAHLPGRVSE